MKHIQFSITAVEKELFQNINATTPWPFYPLSTPSNTVLVSTVRKQLVNCEMFVQPELVNCDNLYISEK